MDRATKQRIAGLTVALILVTPLSIVAARWQWSRHLERDALNAAVVSAAQTQPVPWQELAREPGFVPAVEWRRVTADGAWLPQQQLLVRKQVVSGEVGFTVLTPLRTDDGVTLYVLRGWVQSADATIPAPPTGPVHLTLRVRMPRGEGEIRPADLPPGQVNFVDPPRMADLAGDAASTRHSTVDAVFELLAPVPSGVVALPWPELTSGPHVSYFFQWILIGLTGVVVYVRVFRSELRLSRDDDATGDAPPAEAGDV